LENALILYQNGAEKLLAYVEGGVVTLKQYLDNEITAVISLFPEEVSALYEFVSKVTGRRK